MLPDWQLPPGVDRGLWDYLHSDDMVRGYDAQMAASPVAAADVAFCETVFSTPGRLVDLGCGTGRLCLHFAAKGYDCVGVDLSEEMLAKARENASAANVNVAWTKANLVDLAELSANSFDYAACLFSTLGMVRGEANRRAVLGNVVRVLKPGGRFVLHVHNRWFAGLGRGRVFGQFLKTLFSLRSAGEVTMPQAYGGAALTLHHFTHREVTKLLETNGFEIERLDPLRIERSVYGYLLAAKRR
jgi:ubiquinone/menaquinone biosynthesis C-methylase UbiE